MLERLRHALLGLYAVMCLGAITWPGYAWLGSTIEPRALGAPLAWMAGWVLFTFLVLVAYHATGSDQPADWHDDDAGPGERR